MSIDTIFNSIKEQAANVDAMGSTIKFILDEEVIFIDGTGEGNDVSREDREAACTISTSAETFTKLQEGSLNPMMAVMSGQVKIKGDMGLAMKLQAFV